MSRKLGLALGDGFSRGAAHIGVLKVLEEEGIKPAAVAGTSAGSIVAGLYASGWTVREMEQMARSLTPRDVMDPMLTASMWRFLFYEIRHHLGIRPYGGAPLGLLKGARLTVFLEKLFGSRGFDEMAIPLIVTATDIVSGRRVLFMPKAFCRDEFVRLSKVPVALAVRASCTVPGLFEPVRLGELVLVDGAVREPIPAEPVRLPGIHAVTAVDVGGRTEERQPVAALSDLLTEAWELAVTEGKRRELEAFADVVIVPQSTKKAPWDFSLISEYIKAGEKAARSKLKEIRKALT